MSTDILNARVSSTKTTTEFVVELSVTNDKGNSKLHPYKMSGAVPREFLIHVVTMAGFSERLKGGV